MTDITLRQNILDELEFEPSIDAAHIGVAVEDGIVTLAGHVSSYWEKTTAENVVKRVKGVKGIAEEIEVRLIGHKGIADDEIAKRAVNAITWNLQPEGQGSSQGTGRIDHADGETRMAVPEKCCG